MANKLDPSVRPVIAAAVGAAAGVLVGLAEVAFVAIRATTHLRAVTLAATALVAAGLYSLLFGLAGLMVGLIGALSARSAWRERLRREAASTILTFAIVLPCATAVLFRISHHFATAYRNQTLAAFAMAVCSLFVFLWVLWFRAAALRLVGRIRSERARYALAAVVLIAVLVPPLSAGPDFALEGPFGFFGLLSMEDLDLTPFALLGGGLVSAVLVGRVLIRRSLSAAAALALSPVALAALGAFCLALPGVRGLAGPWAPLLPRVIRPIDRLLDRDHDGFAGSLGGGDCNDSDRAINPAQADIPGNGRDEDCDGEDLSPSRPSAPSEPASVASAVKLRDDLCFLVITIDAFNTDVGFLGYHRYPTTPNLDRLARKSIVFERAYALGTYTAQSIPPMMAGRFPSELRRTSAHEVRYFLDDRFLAEILRERGFRTAGAASHFLFAPLFGWTQGFERFKQIGSEGDAPPGAHVDLRHSSRLVANDAVRILANREWTAGRFLFWFHFLDPHKQYLEHSEFRFGAGNRALYAGELAYTDAHIGRVLSALEAAGLADRTVIVVTGDHGEAFGQHGSFFHGRETWDEIIRVPLLIHVPGLPARRVSRRISHIDVFPTLLELAGVPMPPEAPGQSLVPELQGAELSDRPILVEQPQNPYYRMRRVFIEDGYKLHHLVEERSFRLFNLDSDPEERVDLADSDPERLATIRRSYARFLAVSVSAVEPVQIAPPEATSEQP